ncbi:MAG: hypothetical protein ACKO96_04455, partial [Flammeovirgaceae bacterium]
CTNFVSFSFELYAFMKQSIVKSQPNYGILLHSNELVRQGPTSPSKLIILDLEVYLMFLVPGHEDIGFVLP